MKDIIKNSIKQKILNLFLDYKIELESDIEIDDILEICYEDLCIFAERDPSSKNNVFYILNSYSSYCAVLSYRVSNNLYKMGQTKQARQFSEHTKIKIGIEIHPSAKIGQRFVLDHGIGTVIGETTNIGNDCYILQNVILGSTHIANNSKGSRHPIVGNKVEIGGHVRIYGNVNIGDNVIISPGAIIKNDVPENSKVVVSSNYQIVRCDELRLWFSGYHYNKQNLVLFFIGDNLQSFKTIQIITKNEDINNFKVNKDNIVIKNAKGKYDTFDIIVNNKYEFLINVVL